MIYFRVHLQSHSYSNSPDTGTHEYFKHFFTGSDLEVLFEEKYFERMVFSSTVQGIRSKFMRDMENKWTERVLDEYKIFGQNERQEEFEEIGKELKVGYLECICRRK